MGTNFYEFKDGVEGRHIGKRSAAGLYCHDCGVTLCARAYDRWEKKEVEGEEAVHQGDSFWYDACPKCGNPSTEKVDDKHTLNGFRFHTVIPSPVKKPNVPPLEKDVSTAAMVELGFANSKELGNQTGIGSTSSFTWAMKPDKLDEIQTVVDEYGRQMSLEEFKKELTYCKIKFYHSIGMEFS